MNRLFAFIIGSWLVVIGLFLVIGREVYSRGIRLEYGKADILVGCIFLAVGILIFIYALRTKEKDFEDKFMICPKCKEPFDKADVPNSHCPKCNTKLEALDGFYDRHPELREESRKGKG